jgi:MoaA/NifB/PqqE/SkfB family radical SAM enzyme
MINTSKARPKKSFRLQTNATLLDKHNLLALKEAGITVFTISIDTIDAEVHKELRGGSDLEKILSNIAMLRLTWPEVQIKFVTTVNKLNVDLLDELLGYAAKHKINGVELRRMFYFPKSNVIQDHEKMKAILLDNEHFLSKALELKSKYTDVLYVYVNDATELEVTRTNVKT